MATEKFSKKSLRLLDYIKSNKFAILGLFAIFFLSYWVKLTNFSITMDTEIAVNALDTYNNYWIQIGRWGLVLLGYIVRIFHRFNPVFSNFIMGFFFVAAVVGLGFLIQKITKKTETKVTSTTLLILGGLILTSVIFAEQFVFTLQSGEVAIGVFLAVLAAIFAHSAVFESKKTAILPAILFATIAIGTYQTTTIALVGVLAAVFVLEKLWNRRDTKFLEDLKPALGILIIFAVSFVFCGVVTRVWCKLIGLPRMDTFLGRVSWLVFPFEYCVDRIFFAASEIITPDITSPIHSYAYLAAIILSVVVIFYLVKTRKSQAVLPIVAILFVLFSPLAMILISGNTVDTRTLFAVPLSVGILYATYFLLFKDSRVLRNIILISAAVFSFMQLKMVSDYWYTSDQVYREEVRISEDIITRVDLIVEDRENTPIVFLGTWEPKATSLISRTDGDGRNSADKAFYEWDNPTELQSNRRIHAFLQTLGLLYQLPTVEQVKEAEKYIEEHPETGIYPEKGAFVLTEDYIIVRLK